MISLPRSGLHRQLIFYTFFIGIVFLTMAFEMTIFLRGDRVQLPAETTNLILLKTGLMLAILLLAIGLVMLLFTKRIMFPLGRIIEGTEAMSQGDFSVVLPDQSRDELGELARRINDLTANHQELILLTQNMSEQAKQVLQTGAAETRTEDAIKILVELDETLSEFGRSFYS